MDNKMVTYEPDNSIRKGMLLVFNEIFRELRSNRYLTYQLFKRDFSAMNKQSFIGFLWIFIMPLVNVAVFAMLSRSGILNIGQINVPYPVYALLGMAFWQLFSTGLISTGSSLTAAGDMITRINFSKKSLVIASMGRPILSFLIQWVLIVILFAAYRVLPNTAIFLVPLVVIPIVLLTLGLGFIVSLLNAIVRDTGNLLTVSMTLLMYVTPVLYAKPQLGILKVITKYNPMYYMLSAGRDLVLRGVIQEQNGFLVSVSVSLMIFLVSLALFHLTETRIAERI